MYPKAKELKQTLDNWQLFAPCLGTNVTVYDSLNGFWNSSSGFCVPDPKVKLDSNRKFYVYSITKTFTAVVVMRLIEAGILQLTDLITAHLPDLPLSKAITIKQLLNHTSGVPNYTSLSDYMSATREKPAQPWSFDYVIDRTCKGELEFEPGTGWEYSNTGYMLLLLLIEAVTQQSYAQNIKRFITEKINLEDTYVAESIDDDQLTMGYCRYLNTDRRMENITRKYNPWWCKTGLVVSTTQEITIFYKALFDGKLVNSHSLNQMCEFVAVTEKPAAGPIFKKPSYALGLMIDPENDFGGLYGHGGDGPGFNTWTVYHPDFYGRSISITIFCNTSMNGHPFFLMKDLMWVLKNS